MKATRKIFFLMLMLTCSISLFNSCHKYPEDDFATCKRPFKRLLGTWQFVGFKLDGIDHAHDLDTFLTTKTIYDCEITFRNFNKEKGWYELKSSDGSNVPALAINSGVAHYLFIDEYKNMYISGDQSPFFTALWGGTWSGIVNVEKFNILELSKRYLHLKSNHSDIYFKKK